MVVCSLPNIARLEGLHIIYKKSPYLQLVADKEPHTQTT